MSRASRAAFRRNTGPAIASGLVSDYLGRKLEEWDWIKDVKRKPLERALKGFQFSAKYPPFLHQLQCFNIGIELPHFCFFEDMGAGKTALTLALARWYMKHGGLKKTLIAVRKEVAVQSWIDEIGIHAPELSYVALLGSTEERKELLEQEADLYLINYPGLQLLMSELQEAPGKKSKKRKRKRQIIPQLAKDFAQRFGMVVFDESHRLGNHESLTYRECRQLTKYVPLRYALTGTPFGRDPTPLWAQFHIIDDGETLGDTIGMFRAAFFHAKDRYWGGIEYTFDERMKEDLHRMIKHRSVYYKDSEFADLPPVTYHKTRVRFSTSAEEQYKNVVRRIKEAKGSKEELKYAFARMRMCTSGFLSVKSDLADRLTIFFEENPKLEMLEELVGDIPLDSKCMILHDYIITGDMISGMLGKNGVPHATLWGKTKDPIAEMNRFLHDPEVRFLVANSDSGSESLNPQAVCNYLVFYETPVSPITRKQAEKRPWRTGQKKHVHIYDLIVPGSIDEKILGYLEEGKDLFEAIVQGEEKLI